MLARHGDEDGMEPDETSDQPTWVRVTAAVCVVLLVLGVATLVVGG